jgi:predicted double-glycine peptidase
MNIGDEDAVVVSQAEDDSTGRYAFQAAKAVNECVKERNFPLEFIQAWV